MTIKQVLQNVLNSSGLIKFQELISKTTVTQALTMVSDLLVTTSWKIKI